MFTSMWAQNFKSWRVLDPVRLAPITGIFGSNSSGKTSLLQMLLLMKQTAESQDRVQPLQLGGMSSTVELGSFRDLLYQHDSSETLELGYEWNLSEPIAPVNPTNPEEILFDAYRVSFETAIQLNSRDAMTVRRFSYWADDASVEMERSSSRQRRGAEEFQLHASVKNDAEYLRRTPGRAWPLPSPVKCYGFPDETVAYFQNAGFVSQFELALDRQFSSYFFYLGPLRSNPARQYRWQGSRPQDVGVAGERAIEALLSSRDAGRVNTRAFDARGRARKRISVEQHVAEWLKQLGLIHEFDLQRLSEEADVYRVRVQQSESSSWVALTDVGFGVSQILPVLVLLAWVPGGSTILLEQPEIHLHPAVQTGLADIFVETAKIRGVQVIVESHSEHLLRRLQLRTAEQAIEPEDVALYFSSLHGSESRLTDLRLNLFGEIENWPRDFFGSPLEETAAITRASLLARKRLQAG